MKKPGKKVNLVSKRKDKTAQLSDRIPPLDKEMDGAIDNEKDSVQDNEKDDAVDKGKDSVQDNEKDDAVDKRKDNVQDNKKDLNGTEQGHVRRGYKAVSFMKKRGLEFVHHIKLIPVSMLV